MHLGLSVTGRGYAVNGVLIISASPLTSRRHVEILLRTSVTRRTSGFTLSLPKSSGILPISRTSQLLC